MDKQSQINILDAVVSCDYPVSNRDLIISIFYDCFMGKKCNMFMTYKLNQNTGNYEKVLVVRYFISIMLNTRVYEVPVLIYFPKMFPAEPPEIYVERNEEIAVNPKSGVVDRGTLRIYISSLRHWNMGNSNLNDIFLELSTEFSKCFPVYRLEKKDYGKVNYGENCVLMKDNTQVVTFDAPSRLDKFHLSNYTHNRSSSQPLISLDDLHRPKPQENIINKFSNEKLPTYSDDQIKRIYINEMVNTIFPKIKAEKNKLKIQQEQLNTFKSEFQNRIEKVKSLAERKDEIINRISTLSQGLQAQVEDLKNYIQMNSQLDFSSNLENLDKFLNISDPEVIKAVSTECVLEDMLLLIKKAFEKKIPGFDLNYTIKLIRKFSRELYTIKFYKEKLIYLHGLKK
jgi:hypothetical protein